MKVLVVYYPLYGHIFQLGHAVAEGARSVEGIEAILSVFQRRYQWRFWKKWVQSRGTEKAE